MQSESSKDLAGSGHWIQGYANTKFKRHSKDDVVYNFIRKYVNCPPNNDTAFEIGSFPGTYIAEFGELGYEINGLDLHPENSKSLVDWLISLDYKVGDFYSADLFNFKTDKKYDVVCSFGFIEHFVNYLEVIDIHDDLLENNGIMLVTVPNYRGFVQKSMHKYLSPEDYALHYIPSMNPKKWAGHLEKKGYEILFQGYFGGMNFWIGNDEIYTPFKRFVYYITMRVLPRLNKLLPFESSVFSKNCGIVARKK